MLRSESWDQAGAGEMAPLFAAETARWRHRLDWDTSALWPAIERGRTSGTLPGLVLRAPSGEVVGWTYAAARDGEIVCGALTAPDDAATGLLVDGLLTMPAGRAAARIVCFAYAEAPGLDAVLAARGFQLDPHHYLSRPLGAAPAVPMKPGRTWDVRDLDATADLLGASYPAIDPKRPFAPRGRAEDWRRYVTDLVIGHGCGRFRAALSIAVPGAGGTLDAVAIVTDLGGGTAHLAQLAVRPALRGAGLAARIVSGVVGGAAAAGYRRLTLLVGHGNAAARRLYASHGFTARAQFVSGTCSGGTRRIGRDSPAA